MSTQGFVKVRNGIDEHLANETISLFEEGILRLMSRQADFKTGKWWGNAERLFMDAPRDSSVEMCRAALKHLGQIGWLRSRRKGHANHTVGYLINKFEVTDGVAKGKRLSLELTTDWNNPVFVDSPDGVADDVAKGSQRRSDDVAKASSILDLDLNKDKNKEKIAPSALPPQQEEIEDDPVPEDGPVSKIAGKKGHGASPVQPRRTALVLPPTQTAKLPDCKICHNGRRIKFEVPDPKQPDGVRFDMMNCECVK